MGCAETSVRNYHYLLLRNNPEECSSQLLRGGSLKSSKLSAFQPFLKGWQFTVYLQVLIPRSYAFQTLCRFRVARRIQTPVVEPQVQR
jgi:hypothetical protein